MKKKGVGLRVPGAFSFGSDVAQRTKARGTDVLAMDGRDLRCLPLEERLAQLDMLLSLNKVAGIAMVPSFDDGEALMLACMEHSLQGIVSKRRDSAYTSGRGRYWLKSKTPAWRQANRDRWKRMGGSGSV